MGALELFLLYYGYEEYFSGKKRRPELSPEEKKRRDRRTPRIALKRYSESPFAYLFRSGNDQALMNCCAVDHVTFRELLAMFKPVFESYTVDKKTGEIREKKHKNRGRKREMDAIGALGLVLYWYRTRGSCAQAIAMAFGLTSTPLYLWVKFSRKCLLFALQDEPSARVLPPSKDEVDQMAEAVTNKYPILEDYKVWGAIDGLKIGLQQSGDWFVQNMYYNGWKGSTFVNCVFVFGADGKIRICVINAPGTFHDSSIAEYGVYQGLEKVFDCTGGRVVVDSAFRLQAKGFLLRSAQTVKDEAPIETHLVNEAATSVRQMSEHGMAMIQARLATYGCLFGLRQFNLGNI